MKPLHVLAIHRYYWPDSPPYAAMLQEIVKRWSQEGHDVDVLTSQPSYKKNVDNMRESPSLELIEFLQKNSKLIVDTRGRLDRDLSNVISA